jgi:HD-like signal output (HDOD) protein
MNSTINPPVLLERLGSGRLPVLPANTPMLLRALSNEQLDFREIAAVIEQFPTIAGRLIALANSAWSAPVETILSVEQACSRLGLSVVRSTSLALAVASAFDPSRCPEFEAERYWSDALLCAETAARLCALSPLAQELEPAAARAGGLLHSLGVLWIADRLPQEFGRAVQLQRQSEEPLRLHQALQQVLGFDQGEAGGLLALKWKLPEELELAMSLVGDHRAGHDRPMESVVGYAIVLVRALHEADDCPLDDPRVPQLQLGPQDCGELQQQLQQQAGRLQELARTLFV